jgi:YegS/Rv2252/BmrU family lipid kinase
MTPSRKIAVVANLLASSGRVRARWPEIISALQSRLHTTTSLFTEKSGHGIELTRDLLRQGYDLVVAAGGDGTINEVANGFVNSDGSIFPGAAMGILPLGTGGDFQRTLGICSKLEDAVEILASGKSAPIDVGKAEFAGLNGAPVCRYFVNVASFGMGGAVASHAKNLWSRWSGRLAFLWATFATVASYRGKRITLEIDDTPAPTPFRITNVAIGNGRFHGGGMHPCPTAVLNDGIFEVTVIKYLNPFELARDIRILYSANVYQHPKVHHFHVRRIIARSEERTLVEIDGEPLGELPLEVTMAPGRLPMVVPPSSPLLPA